MNERSRYASAARRLSSGQTWRQIAAMTNFFGYDSSERRRARLGSAVRISPTASFRNGERISIGDGSHIGQWSSLWAGDQTGRISIGSHALLAPRVFVTSSNYDVDAALGPVMDLPHREADVVIGANTWLGVGVIVLPGVTIGEETVVAAGAVVSRDLPPGVLAAGIPARPLRRRADDPARHLLGGPSDTMP